MNSKINKIIFWGLIAVLCVLMGVFCFVDLQISRAVFNKQSKFGLFFKYYGELPFPLAVCAFGAAGYLLFKKMAVKVAFILIGLIGAMMAADKIFSPYGINDIAFYALSVALALIICAAFVVGFKRINSKTLQKLFSALFICALFCIGANLIVQILKITFGRVRFVNLNEDFSNFTRWFEINFNSKNYSFPSGHTAAAMGALSLSMVAARVFPSNRAVLAASIFMGAVWVLCTAISRIILGAHYASDVTFSIILCLVCLKCAISVEKRLKLKYI